MEGTITVGEMIGEWLQGGDSVTEQDAATDAASANILRAYPSTSPNSPRPTSPRPTSPRRHGGYRAASKHAARGRRGHRPTRLLDFAAGVQGRAHGADAAHHGRRGRQSRRRGGADRCRCSCRRADYDGVRRAPHCRLVTTTNRDCRRPLRRQRQPQHRGRGGRDAADGGGAARARGDAEGAPRRRRGSGPPGRGGVHAASCAHRTPSTHNPPKPSRSRSF